MSTKKALLGVIALIACLAVCTPTVATAKTKKKKNIRTTIGMTVTTTNAGPYSPDSTTVFGNVRAKGPKGCTRGRTVAIFRDGLHVATSVTGQSGEYSASIEGSSSGNWQAGVTSRVIKKKKKHKKFICKLAVTGVVVIP
jgi:hypothetical protein